ncbi:MAG: hypothetical protein IJ680_03010, partial [Paludibacteraceae bacterium]|nr:hypothetical protein [Paludibacteraceae bacterium]
MVRTTISTITTVLRHTRLATLLHSMRTRLLLCLAVFSTIGAVAQVQVDQIEEGKPYWIRFTMSRGLNLSTRKPDYRTSNISLRTADFTDLSQVFYFKHSADNKYYIYTHESDGYKYITRASNDWDMTFITQTDETLPTFTRPLPLVYDVPNTKNIRISVDGNTTKGITSNRGTIDGMSVAYNSTIATIYQWVLIPWEPLNYLKQALDEVDELISTAEIGTEYYQVKSQSYIDALQSVYTTSLSTYTTLHGTIGDATPDASQLAEIQTAWDNLLTARRTFLDEAYNPVPQGYYIISSERGDYIRLTGNDSYWVKATTPTSGEIETPKILSIEVDGENAHIKSGDYYLSLSNDKYTTDQLQNTQTYPQWQTAPANNRHQLKLRHLGHKDLGIYFNSVGNGTKKDFPWQTNESYLTYDHDIDFSSNAGPYKLRALRLEDRDNADLINPNARWTLASRVKYHIIDNNGKEAAYDFNIPSGVLNVPQRIKSPLVSSYRYYATLADAIAGTNEIDTETGHNDIYVRYSYDNASSTVDLEGNTWYSISFYETRTLYASSNTQSALYGNATDTQRRHSRSLWKMTGNDPYNIVVENRHVPGTYLTKINRKPHDNEGVPIQALDANPATELVQHFIITQAEGADTYQLMATGNINSTDATDGDFIYLRSGIATGGTPNSTSTLSGRALYQHGHEALQITFEAYQDYHIVDLNGDEVLHYAVAPRDELSVPQKVKSPLASSWEYYATLADAQSRTNALSTAHGHSDIYVRYSYDSDSSPIDILGGTWYVWVEMSNQRIVHISGNDGQDHIATYDPVNTYRNHEPNSQWKIQGTDPYRLVLYSSMFPDKYASKINRTRGYNTELRGRDANAVTYIQTFTVTQAEGSTGYQLMGNFNPEDYNASTGDFYYINSTTGNNYMYLDADINRQHGHDLIQMQFTPYRLYHIIRNDEGEEALSYSEPVVDDVLHLPTAIRSPLIQDADYTYYATLADARAKTNPISSTTGHSDIYVRYTYDNDASPIDLQGGTWYIWKMPYADRWIYSRTDVEERLYTSNGNRAYTTNDYYLWKLEGNDPYYVTFVNKQYPDRVMATKTALTANNVGVNLFLMEESEVEGQRYFSLVQSDEDGAFQMVAPGAQQTDQQYQSLFYYMRIVGNNNDNFYFRSNGAEQDGFQFNKVKLENVTYYTFHLTTKFGHREFSVNVEGAEGEQIEIPQELIRRFTEYTFYTDKDFTQPITHYPGVLAKKHDIYVDYSTPNFTDANGFEYNVFSTDYDHAYWFTTEFHPYDHAMFWTVRDETTGGKTYNNALGFINDYNDGNSVKIWPGDFSYNANRLFAFIGDAYDTKIINRELGPSKELAAYDDEIADTTWIYNQHFMVFSDLDEKPNNRWEMRINGTSANDIRLDNFNVMFSTIGGDQKFTAGWFTALASLASGNSMTIKYVPDRVDVAIHIYDLTKGHAAATKVLEADYFDLQRRYKAGEVITEVPDTLFLPGLKYYYYTTLADLQANQNGTETLAAQNIVAAAPSHDPTVPIEESITHIYIGYTLTEDYPIAFSNPGDKVSWYFVAHQQDALAYGWTVEDMNQNDNFSDLLRWPLASADQTAANQRLWGQDIRINHATLSEKTFEQASTTMSDQIDATKKPANYLWKFEGNPYFIRLYNKKAGNGMVLAADNATRENNWGTNPVRMVDAGTSEYDTWRILDTRHTVKVKYEGTGEEEPLPHFTLRLAANADMALNQPSDRRTSVLNLSTRRTEGGSHRDCMRIYHYLHKSYFNARVHLKNESSGTIRDYFVSKDDLGFWLEQPVTQENLSDVVKRQYCAYTLYDDDTYSHAVTSIDYSEAYDLFTDIDGNLLNKEDYWDYENDQVSMDADIYIDIYLSYSIDENAPVKFYNTVDELLNADPNTTEAWYMLQLGVAEGSGYGEYVELAGMSNQERTFLNHSKANSLNFLCRSGSMSNIDNYGNQRPTTGDEDVTSINGRRYFASLDTVLYINMLSPRNDFRRIAETYMDGTDAKFREGRWLWGFVGDPYGFEVVNREASNKRLTADVHVHNYRQVWNEELEKYETIDNVTITKIRLTDRYSTSEGTYIWEMAMGDASTPGSFSLKVKDDDKYVYPTSASNPVLTYKSFEYDNVDSKIRSVIAHPWHWKDNKYKTVTVNIYRDAVGSKPVVSRTFTPADRTFMEGDVIDGTEGHFYMPHNGDENYNADLTDGHLIDIPYELKRHFCTYSVEGGSYTVQSTDEEQVLNIIFHVQTPDEDHPYIPRFLAEEELASFRVVDELGTFTNLKGETLSKSDYYYFLDIGNTLGYHALINPDEGGIQTHPYDVVDNRFKRNNPTQLQWFFVGDPYELRLFNVYFTNHKGEGYKDKEFNLARNMHRNNFNGEYGTGEDVFNKVYMEEVRNEDNPHAPHGRVFWEMVEPRRNPATGRHLNRDNSNIRYRYQRIKDLPFALRLTKPHSYDFPDEATASAHPDDDAYKTHLGQGTAFYLTSTANGAGQAYKPYNYNTWGAALYYYRGGETNPRGNELQESMLTFPDLTHKANMNPDAANGTSSMFTAMPVGRVYVTVYDHEDTDTKVTDFELSDYYAITDRFRGVPANLQRDYCNYTKISNNENMSGDNIADDEGYVEVVNGTAHIYATYQETPDAPFCKQVGDNLVKTDVYGNTTSSTSSLWYNMSINGQWAFFNSNFRGFDYETGTENHTRVDVKSAYSGSINASAATTADDWRFRKGLSWALVGDPYSFKLQNKRDITIGQGSLIDGEYESYSTSPAFLTEDESGTRIQIGNNSDAYTWTLVRNAAANMNNDAAAVYFLSESEQRRTEVTGPINGFYTSSIYNIADASRNVNTGGEVKQLENPTNYDLGATVSLIPSEYIEYENGTNNGGAGNEGFDAIVNVYNRLNELVATTGWTELSRQRAEWSLNNNLPADVRRWSCTYQLWADPTMTSSPFNSYRDKGSDGEYLIKDGGIVYVTYDYDEALFSTENEYRWVNPFFNWDDQKKTWPLIDREIYKYTAEMWDYSVTDGGASHRYIMPEANVRMQTVPLFMSKNKPTIPYQETKEGWLESPASNGTYDVRHAYAFSSHQYKSQARYEKDGEWDAFTDSEKAARSAEDMKVQKWALIGDPYKFILYNYYRRNDAYIQDKNAYYLQYKDGQIINDQLPEADREIAEGEAPTAGYSKEKLQGVYWTWKVNGQGYTYKKKNPLSTDEQIETTATDHSCEITGECTVNLRESFYETDEYGNRTGELKEGFLAVCDMTASSLYDKHHLVGSVLGYATFEQQSEAIITMDGESTYDGTSTDFNLYTKNGVGAYDRTTVSLTNGAATPMIGSAYTIGFNDKYRGYMHFVEDYAHNSKGGENGNQIIHTIDRYSMGSPLYERDYYDPDPSNTQYTNFAEWRGRYGKNSYTYTHYEGTPNGVYTMSTRSGEYYTGGTNEGISLPLYLTEPSAAISRDGEIVDMPKLGPEPETDYITYKKVQIMTGVAPTQQYLTLTGGPSTVDGHLSLGSARRFLVTTMPIHAASITFHLDPEDHGQDNGGRTSMRDFEADPIYDYTSEDYGIGNDLTLPWLMRRQYCNYTYYLEWIKNDFDATYVDDLQYSTGEYNKGRLASRSTAYDTFWSNNISTRLVPAASGSIEVPDEWEDKHVYIRVTYEPDQNQWNSSNWSSKNPDDVHWYNLATQNAEDMPQYLMQYTRSNFVRGINPDQREHTTNDYLWAVEGDPYGFYLHNRYAAHWYNGVSPDGGTTWPEANENWSTAVMTTDYVNSHERHNYDGAAVSNVGTFTYDTIYNDLGEITGTKPQYQADIRFANAGANTALRMLNDKERIDSEVSDVAHAPTDYALYEGMTGNYHASMMMHPVKAPINTRDENGIKYYTSYVFNGVNWPVQLNYLLEWQAMRNVYCNWILTLPSAAQLLPYWKRAGYALALQPETAAAKQSVSLYTNAANYASGTLTPMEVDFYKILQAIDAGHTGPGLFNSTSNLGRANINRVLEAARTLVHNPKNLVNINPSGNHYRLLAYSSIANPAEHRLGTSRYVSAPLHQREATENLSLHFYESLDYGRTFDSLELRAATMYGQGAATRFSRSQLGLPETGRPMIASAYNATRGQIPIEAATFDASAIFRMRDTGSGSTHHFWTFQTQGLDENQGVYLNDTASAFAPTIGQYDVQDIGATAVQIQTRTSYENKLPGLPGRVAEAHDYMGHSPEKAFYAVKHGTELSMTMDSIYDTRWLLQTIGEEAENVSGATYSLPLCMRVYEDR